ncbi:MAG TPA: hypothetical protein VLG12_06160 [Candidatus Saccharimonadales bacterium]|nr:hypothetical protein [Candidatus Saccharimonadales bacterium]
MKNVVILHGTGETQYWERKAHYSKRRGTYGIRTISSNIKNFLFYLS